MPKPWPARVVSVVTPAWQSLRMYRGTTLLLFAVAAATVAAILPAVALLAPEWSTRLRLTGSPEPPGDSTGAEPPAPRAPLSSRRW